MMVKPRSRSFLRKAVPALAVRAYLPGQSVEASAACSAYTRLELVVNGAPSCAA
jgi:hypothetical protein